MCKQKSKLQVIESCAGPENKVNYVMITLNAYEGEAVSHLVKDWTCRSTLG